MFDNIFVCLFVVLMVIVFASIVWDCIRDCSVKKKILYVLLVFSVIGIYAFIIYLIRTYPPLVDYRRQHGSPPIFDVFFFIMLSCLIIGGFAPLKRNPKTKKEKFLYFLLKLAWYMCFILLLLLPFILAFEID